jgi:signal transduction histidine kinase
MTTSRLHMRLQVSSLLAMVATFVVLALLTPGVLLLEPGVATAALLESAWTFPVIAALAAVTTVLRLHRFGPALRALELGEGDVPGVDAALVLRLDALPLSWVLQLALGAALVWSSTLLPALRPSLIDARTQASLFLLALTVIGASSLPLYVAARALVSETIEAAPWRVVDEAMREAGPLRTREPSRLRRALRWLRRRAHSRVRGRLANAVAVAVAIVAFGALLLVDAHVRAFDAGSRRDDAYALARGLLELEGTSSAAGREAAIRAAEDLGYSVNIVPAELAQYEPGPGTSFGEGGTRELRTPLDDGSMAVVRFQATSGAAPYGVYGLAAALAIFAAALVGRAIGLAVSRDLGGATREVNLLGTRDVLRGATRVAGPARFDEVAELGSGVEAVAERFREFAQGRERMIEARESAQRMRDLFLASMSHDLRSPLNGILGFVELLQKQELTQAQRESLAIIDRRGRELLELIENILDAAKIEAGRLELQRDWIAPAELLATAVRRGRELALEKSGAVEVRGELQEGLGPMWIDGQRLGQAITNLVANAVKYCDRGVVRVRVARAARLGDEGVRIDVEDQGRGIPEKDLAQIFDAFRQPIRSRRHGGLGLGLTMTRAMVELHGGSIEVTSSPEHGSVFTLFLPTPRVEEGDAASDRSPRMRPFRVPTPAPGSRPPFDLIGQVPEGASEAQTTRAVHEDPTVQMPALEVPPEPDARVARPPAAVDGASSPTEPPAVPDAREP